MIWAGGIAASMLLFVGLLLGGMWVPFALGVTSLLLIYLADGWTGFNALGLLTWGSVNSFSLTAIPMFILMAEFLVRSGVGANVYRGLAHVVRRLPGGLLQTNVVGCAMFAAISGSSVATAAGIGSVALPQLLEKGYDRRLSAGTLVAGGTLGILIPPSIAMILYGTFTETSIARLFMAGLLPGLLLTGIFALYVAVVALLRPQVAPRQPAGEDGSLRAAIWDLAPFLVLITLVLGSLYLGFATPTEAGALGSSLALVIAVVWGHLRWTQFRAAVSGAVRVSASLLLIVLAAYLFAYALDATGVAQALTRWVVELELGRLHFLLLLFLVYCILGCFIDSIGMIVLTVPLVFPVLVQYGIDPIWFGVVLVVLIELGQITPPMGINLFVVQNIWSGKFSDVVLGTVPFYFLMLLFLALMTAFPQIALFLPGRMQGM